MRFKCVPVMREPFEQIAAPVKWRHMDFQKDDGGYIGEDDELVLVYLCFDIEKIPCRRPTFQYGGQSVIRAAKDICRGFLGLQKGYVGLLLDIFDEAALTPAQSEEIKNLCMKTISDCTNGNAHPSLF